MRIARLLGTIAVGIVGFHFCRKVWPWMYTYIIAPRIFGPSLNVRRLGDWAVVAGSTDAIGKEYAIELARKGMKLVLISRSLEKLKLLAKEITDEFEVEVRIIDVDFTGGVEVYDKIRDETDGLDVGVLVNNVAIGYSPEYFLNCNNTNPSVVRSMIAVNIQSVTRMCAIILPGMVARRKGAVINISSAPGVIPSPLLRVYADTKAFVNKFSDDLQSQFRHVGLSIKSVQLGDIVRIC